MVIFFYYFFLFFIYSVIGWIAESSFVAIKTKKFTDRGFLIGPYCPVYGCGALAMVFYLEQYRSNALTVFILGVVICSVIEYFTSYVMEILFKARWWDYSNRKFNLNGRVCGENALLFGFGALFVVYVCQPIFVNLLQIIPSKILLFISVFVFICFLSDVILSLNIGNQFKKTITSIDIRKDSTQEFSKMVQETLRNNHQILQKRLMSAFPGINFDKLVKIKEDIKEELQELLKK